ncbi:MAG: hypothetical protein ACOY4K_02385 [Pseudomonadota bacterium]
MSAPLFLPMALGGFAVALLHTALPTHWLPFVLVGRGQGWRLGRVLTAAGVAAVGHILATTAVAGLILAVGRYVERWIQGALHYAAAGLLLAFGVFYLARAFQRRAVFAGLSGETRAAVAATGDRAAFLGLVGALALSPGEVLLSFFIAGPPDPARFAFLALVFLAGTAAGMALFISLTWAGLARFHLERLERNESAVLGTALLILAAAVMVFRG